MKFSFFKYQICDNKGTVVIRRLSPRVQCGGLGSGEVVSFMESDVTQLNFDVAQLNFEDRGKKIWRPDAPFGLDKNVSFCVDK